MLTAIILTAAIVIAVGIYSLIILIIYALMKTSSKYSRIEESTEWARKWNEQRAKEGSKWCTDECLHCEQNDWCKFSEVKE